MFDKDVRHYRMAPRSLNDAFGPYAKLHVPRRKSRGAAFAWMAAYGIGIAVIWYVILLLRVA